MDHARVDQLADAELLNDRLCVVLYRASHAMTAAYRALLDPLGLTYPQYTVLSALWQQEFATVKELGSILDSDHNTMSPLIKRLEGKGLVRRQRSQVDEREVVVHLTDQGRRLRRRADGVQCGIARATGLDVSDRAQLINDLRGLTARLEVSTRLTAPGASRRLDHGTPPFSTED